LIIGEDAHDMDLFTRGTLLVLFSLVQDQYGNQTLTWFGSAASSSTSLHTIVSVALVESTCYKPTSKPNRL
jgi:hypothetical protein